MNYKPILFNTEMVRAVLDGRKTETRRIIKKVSIDDWDKNDPNYGPFTQDQYGDHHKTSIFCPYGQVGDRLWVRETFWHGDLQIDDKNIDKDVTIYRADEPSIPSYGDCVYKWKPSIFMFRKFSRITLEITEIKVQRVQDITEEGALSEGIIINDGLEKGIDKLAAARFADLSDSITKKRGFGWDLNPWVWVVKFKVVE